LLHPIDMWGITGTTSRASRNHRTTKPKLETTVLETFSAAGFTLAICKGLGLRS